MCVCVRGGNASDWCVIRFEILQVMWRQMKPQPWLQCLAPEHTLTPQLSISQMAVISSNCSLVLVSWTGSSLIISKV